MQGPTVTIEATLYSVHEGIIKKHHGTIHKFIPCRYKAYFEGNEKQTYIVYCSDKPGVIYGRTMWFEEDNPENVTRVVEAFKEKYAGQINDYQKRIATLGLYLEGTWKVI